MTYIPYLGAFFFSRYPSVALARNLDYLTNVSTYRETSLSRISIYPVAYQVD